MPRAGAPPLLRDFIAEFAATFDGSKWGHNGPYLVSRVTRRMPELDVTVLPPRAFYPVDWNKIGGLFMAPKDRKEEKWVQAKVDNIRGGSFGIHLWNRESRGIEMEEGSVIRRYLKISLASVTFFLSSGTETSSEKRAPLSSLVQQAYKDGCGGGGG
uniref:Lactosylceramide 4-alpha-galactosyltransferase n=1 Tax=Aegilops tauschii TaxID=37682 RepID=R7W3T4_AEGTA